MPDPLSVHPPPLDHYGDFAFPIGDRPLRGGDSDRRDGPAEHASPGDGSYPSISTTGQETGFCRLRHRVGGLVGILLRRVAGGGDPGARGARGRTHGEGGALAGTGAREEEDRPGNDRQEKQNPGRIPEGRGGPGAYLMTVTRPGGGVKAADGDLLSGLEAAFSPERMGTYLQAAQGDRDQALRLYKWNTAVCAAFYGPLQDLEVALRNAMHRELAACYGEEWYDNPAAGLDRGARERIANARMTAQRAGHDATPSRVVATLAFGFWIALLGAGGPIERAGPKADYEKTLWRPALRGAFPHRAPLTRRQAHEPLDALRALRNRIAHHEPVFARPLREDHDRILEVTGWISPDVRAWIERYSRVPSLLDAADGPIDDF